MGSPMQTVIELSIKLSDGSFETSVRVPVTAPIAQRTKAVERWLGLAGEALKQGVSDMAATWEPTLGGHGRTEE
jgi:hypothetical protein